MKDAFIYDGALWEIFNPELFIKVMRLNKIANGCSFPAPVQVYYYCDKHDFMYWLGGNIHDINQMFFENLLKVNTALAYAYFYAVETAGEVRFNTHKIRGVDKYMQWYAVPHNKLIFDKFMKVRKL